MISLGLFFLILCSGSFFCAVRFQSRFEEILPLTAGSAVILIFLTGLMGSLTAGVYIAVLLAFLLYAAGLFLVLRRKSWKDFLGNLVTPGLLIFCLFYGFFVFVHRGRLAAHFDEFSHWVDVVKVMITLDDFGTNPASLSLFPSYPPATAIFQYLLQKLACLTGYGDGFAEWLVYVAGNLFLVIPVLPFLRTDSWRRLMHPLLAALVLFLCPTVLMPLFYDFVGADAPLSMLLAAGMAWVILREKNLLSLLHVSLICILLVLTKDVGLLLALFLGGIFCADLLLEKKPLDSRKARVSRLVFALLPLLLTVLFKLLWKLELSLSQATLMFHQPVDTALLKDLLLGRDQTYRSESLHTFARGFFFDRGLEISHIGGKLPFSTLAVLEFTLLYIGIRRWNRQAGCKPGRHIWVAVSFLGLLVLFTVGLAFAYVFQYTEFEALHLSSFERYLCIPFVAGLVTTVLLLLAALDPPEQKSLTPVLALLCAALFLAPMGDLWAMASGDRALESRMVRKEFDAITEKIEEVVPPEASIYFIAQEDDGFDRFVEKFNVRPRPVSPQWSLGQPSAEGDTWTRDLTPEQWQQELLDGYDYVALYKINDYFVETYSSLFEDPSRIQENTVFSVNRDTGLLTLCP